MSVHRRLRLLAFPARTGTASAARPEMRPPGSRAGSLRTCQGLRPRRTVDALALTRVPVSPSAMITASASQWGLSRLNGWPMRTPADASPLPSRTDAHGSGPMRLANPFIVADFHRLLLAGLPAHYQFPRAIRLRPTRNRRQPRLQTPPQF